MLCCGPAAVGLRLLRSSLSLLQRPKLPAAAGSELFIVLYHLAGPLWWPCSLLQWLAANSYDSVPLLICHPHLIILNILSSPSLTFLPFQIALTRLESNIEWPSLPIISCHSDLILPQDVLFFQISYSKTYKSDFHLEGGVWANFISPTTFHDFFL